jgi:hypothetical protein
MRNEAIGAAPRVPPLECALALDHATAQTLLLRFTSTAAVYAAAVAAAAAYGAALAAAPHARLGSSGGTPLPAVRADSRPPTSSGTDKGRAGGLLGGSATVLLGAGQALLASRPPTSSGAHATAGATATAAVLAAEDGAPPFYVVTYRLEMAQTGGASSTPLAEASGSADGGEAASMSFVELYRGRTPSFEVNRLRPGMPYCFRLSALCELPALEYPLGQPLGGSKKSRQRLTSRDQEYLVDSGCPPRTPQDASDDGSCGYATASARPPLAT